MNERQPTPRLATTHWRKSSYSAANNECIEVSHHAAHVNIRDSKASEQRGLTVSTDAFAFFVTGLKGK
ncbi:DUF397 domain-containing protein [Streptomyces ardesiacus]|uniref:DUF397 domain-containing protein n=1 Tax=Streptomyces ardesiacus TaxID=285564 RepID=UPI00201F013B|nr:DUF397 domain-containing protein [Streptomyces ardesiacus]MCL7367556.1 DUF397 domain-containing protein [Streptomyces ardesiacus]